ncbi:MAG: PorT family protein [Rikenellaceae bacterium]|nr:PorT family protein [Rikenellaceae bacterium]
MKKILLAACIILGGFSGVRAQSLFQFGVKGGLLVNSSDLKYTFSGNRDRYDKSSTKPGFELGFQARLRLPLGFLLQPEIVYSRTNGTFPIDETNGGGGQYGDKLKIRSNWIEVPVLVGWKFSIVRLMLGPSFRFPMDEVMNAGVKEAKVAPRLQSFVMGYQAGIGIDLGRLTVDARYCGNFTNITDKGVTDIYTPNLKVNERKVAISIGYMILK